MMVKCFNTEGVCLPELHYMVNVNRQLNEIKMLVGVHLLDRRSFSIKKAGI